MLAPKRTDVRSWGNKTDKQHETKDGTGHDISEAAHGALEIAMHGDGHETWGLREPVRIWASSRSRV